MNKAIDALQSGNADAVNDLTDEDLRQLVIHYATIIRSPDSYANNEKGRADQKAVLAAWRNLPEGMYPRMHKMIMDEVTTTQTGFWVRPATINNKYGIK